MKVIQINAIYGRKSTGTIVREIQACSEKNGIDSYVAYSIADRPDNEVPKGYRIGNRSVAKWHAFISRVFGKQAYFSRLSTWRFLHWLDKANPDVVHLHNLHSNYIHLNMLLRFLSKRDIATVITMHDCWYFTGGCMHYASISCNKWKLGCGDCPVWKRIPSFLFDKTRNVLSDRKKYLAGIPRLMLVGCSEWIANEARQSLLKDNDITVIHNGFDLRVFTPTMSNRKKELGIQDKFVILGPASKWLMSVNQPTFDYFVSHLPEDTIMVLFGFSGTIGNMPSKVLTLGYTKDPRVMAEIYSMADVMVNCSRQDTLSSLNLECQACGTPVVTYDATGSKETVDGVCGFSVTTGDEEALWKKVIEVKMVGKQKLSEHCRNWIEAHFEKSKNYEKYIELYHEITRK